MICAARCDWSADSRHGFPRGKGGSVADLTDAEIDAAPEHEHGGARSEPRVAAAHHDRASRRVVVDLTSGCTFALPPRMAQGRETATEEELLR